MMVEMSRFINSEFQHMLGAWCETDFTRHEPIPTANDAFDGLASPLEIDTQAREHVTGHAFSLPDQAKQEMLGADVVVLEALRFFLSDLHDFSSSLGEPVKARSPLPTRTSSHSAGTSAAATS